MTDDEIRELFAKHRLTIPELVDRVGPFTWFLAGFRTATGEQASKPDISMVEARDAAVALRVLDELRKLVVWGHSGGLTPVSAKTYAMAIDELRIKYAQPTGHKGER